VNVWHQVIALSAIAVCVANTSRAQPAIDDLSKGTVLWLQRDFEGAYEALKRHRDSSYGRSFEVDFMLGTSACRMQERRDRGAAFLEWILYTYSDRLTDEGVRVVKAELSLCRDQPRSLVVPELPAVGRIMMAGGRYEGKVFYREYGDYIGSNVYVAQSAPLPEARIRERWIVRGKKTDALRIAQQAMPRASASVFSRFVIVSQSNHNQRQLADANRQLERYLNFFVTNYGMTAPNHYMFVYLVPSIEQLSELAQRYHSIRPGRGTIAYSFRDDLSIAAVIPATLYGSLFHELFHLLARSNFGDIPTWLDEGIAALYEVSQADGGGVRGMPNWRGDVLKRFPRQIPPLRELIEQRDSSLADADDRGRDRSESNMMFQRRAVFAATARYFALYLQERGKLFDTYKAVREFSASEDFTGTANGVISLVERSSDTSIENLDKEFRIWLLNVEPRPDPLRSNVGPRPPQNRGVVRP
jgi:hypothetical protein